MYINSPSKAAGGSAGTLVLTSSNGTYNDDTAEPGGGTYIITIHTGGDRNAATFDQTNTLSDSTQNNILIPSNGNVSIGGRGITANFSDSTFQATSDVWTIRIDLIPSGNVQMKVGTINTTAGSGANVTNSNQNSFIPFTDPTTQVTLMNGSPGMGSYNVTPDLKLTIPANPYANAYTATMTETVN